MAGDVCFGRLIAASIVATTLAISGAHAQIVINTLDQGAQTPGSGVSVTVTGNGSITGTVRGVTGAGNNVVTVETPIAVGGGRIIGSQAGARLDSGGTVTIQTGATVQGGSVAGVQGLSTTVTIDVQNSGTITNSSTGRGAYLRGGGTVGNSGTILGNNTGVEIENGSAATNMVTNSGAIRGGQTAAVRILGSGTVDNQTGGVIERTAASVSIVAGVTIGGVGTVTNAGAISGVGTNAVSIGNGGMVTNNTGGTITSNGTAVTFNGAVGSVENHATITGTGGFGVTMSAGGSVTNDATITGGGGINISGGTAANFVTNLVGGTITGTLLTAVEVAAGGTVTNNGTITGAGGVTANGGMVTNTSMITANGNFGTGVQMTGGGTINNSGTITSNSAALSISGGVGAVMLTNEAGGEIIGGGGTFDNDAIAVGGLFEITNHGLIRGRSGSFFTAIFGTGAGTLTNTGTIENTVGATAIEFTGSAQTFENSGTVNGDVLMGGGDDTVILHPTSSINSMLDGGAGTGDLLRLTGMMDTTGTIDLTALPVTGFELGEKTGAGTWQFTGASTAFAPTLDVQQGTLVINSDTPNLVTTVDAGAVIAGAGTTGQTTVAGTVAPGNSIGTLNVTGPYLQQMGSTYEVEIEPGGTSDLINVTGAATIETGTTVQVLKASGAYTAGTRFTILSATGGVTGTYTNLAQFLPFLDLEINSDANNIYLDILTSSMVAFTQVAETPNQFNAAFGTQALGASNPIYDAVLSLTEPDARMAFDLLSGEVHASVIGTFSDESRYIRDAVNRRLRQSFSPTGPAFGLNVTPVAAEANPGFSQPAMWAHGFGAWGDRGGDGNAAREDRSTAGIIAGADGMMDDDWRVGFAVGFSHSRADVDARASDARADSYHLALYGGREWGPWGLRLGGALAFHDVDTDRSIAFPGFAAASSASYDARTAQLFTEVGHRIDAGTAVFEPFGGLAYVNVGADGFTETGGAAALRAGDSTMDTVFSTIGIRGESQFDVGGTPVTAHGTLAWRHAFGDATPETRFTFAGAATQFTIAGTPIARDALVVEGGLGIDLNARTRMDLTYSGQVSGRTEDHAAEGRLTLRF